MANQPANIHDDTWNEVLVAVDKTYAELVSYQERLEAQNNELNTLRRFLSSVMASISDYLVVIDRNGQIFEAGQATCTALGFDLEHAKTLNVVEVFRALGGQDLNAILSDVVLLRKEVTIEAELFGEGVCEPVELRIAPRLDRRRKAIGAVLTARPLGELKRAYAKLEASHDELKQAQVQLVRNEKLASLGRLLAGVAHELNNPISFVYANTHAMEKYIDRFESYFDRVNAGAPREELVALRSQLKLDREMRNLRLAIDGARDGSKRVRDLIEDLRRLSADGSGEFERFDLVEAARNAISWIERGTKRNLDISFQGAPVCYAYGRIGHIQQVLLNLVQNAADATETLEEARIELRFGNTDDHVELTILDNGPGVDRDKIPQIFDPFFTTKEVGRGTGLGLSISHKIVEEHGGQLRYCEENQSGACFQMRLPSKSIE